MCIQNMYVCLTLWYNTDFRMCCYMYVLIEYLCSTEIIEVFLDFQFCFGSDAIRTPFAFSPSIASSTLHHIVPVLYERTYLFIKFSVTHSCARQCIYCVYGKYFGKSSSIENILLFVLCV